MNGEDEAILRRIQRVLRELSVPRPPVERVVRRSKVLRARRYLGASVLVVLLGAAVGVPLLMLAPLGQGDGVVGNVEAGSEGRRIVMRDVASVECGEGMRPRSLTSPVIRQPDGVHFQLSNPGRAAGLWIIDPEDPQRNWARGALAKENYKEFTLPVPSGEFRVLCVHSPVEVTDLPNEQFSRLTVLPATETPAVGPSPTPKEPNPSP